MASIAPTVIANDAEAGDIFDAFLPSLPAATATVKLAATRLSTASFIRVFEALVRDNILSVGV